ncbi:flagellar hook-length control protein FliK [Bosea sp. NPDC055594]
MPVQPTIQANLATLAQSQNFATLLAALNSAGLKAGNTVEARLLSLDGEGNATALVNGVKIALLLAGPEARQAALQPGATLLLRFDEPAKPGAPMQAVLIGSRPASSGSPARAPGQTAPSAQTALATPRPGAFVQQPVTTAGATLPAAGAAASISASIAATATASIASPLPTERASAAIPAPGIQPQHAPASPRMIAGPLLGAAIARQDSLAPLFANLGALAQGSVALVLPKPLLALVDQILAQRLPVEGKPLTAEALRNAVARSGVFLEARQAIGEARLPQADLKAGLQALRDLLRPAIQALPARELRSAEGEPAPARPSAQTGPSAAALPAADSRPAMPRAGLLTPQPAQEPSLTAAARPAAIAQTLFEQTESGLDRITLAQYASLPPETGRSEPQAPQRWLVELPLALHDGTALLPLEIERDPPQPGAATPEAPIWRVRFGLDAEPLGALQGLVTLQGRAISVSFWAEREETSRLLRQAGPDLEASLVQARFDSAALEVHTGQPRPGKAVAGQFLDRRS